MAARRNSRGPTSNINQEREPDNAAIMAPPITGIGSRLRITPRNSAIGEVVDVAAEETPHNILRQLSAILPKPTTPLRRAPSTGPPSIRRSNRRTPAIQDRTPGAISKTPSALRPNMPTTYARAAMKKAEMNRAARLTPGKDRRQSGRQLQRETPRDPLRALSKILARDTKAIEPSPQVDMHSPGKVPIRSQEDDDDEREPIPRLSMPLDGEDDDSLLLPKLSSNHLAEDETLTQRSMELPRNTVGGNLGGRFSRGSYGSIRTSDQFGDLNEFGLNVPVVDEIDSSFIQQGDLEQNDDAGSFPGGDQLDAYIDEQTAQLSMVSGRASDIRSEMPSPDETEDTFVLTVPLRNSLPRRPSVEGHTRSDDEDDSSAGNEDEIMAVDIVEESEVDQQYATDGISKHGRSSPQTKSLAKGHRQVHKIKKRVRISKYGIQYPSLPAGVVRRLATTFLRAGGNNKSKLGKDALDAITQASDWFFEQVSDDLGIYAQHAGRKTIEENDMMTLMKRQRQTNALITPFALAQRYLPRELLQELRMPNHSKSRSARYIEAEQEEDEG